MQTSLLGLAIAIILALIAALTAPLFIDWGRYRADFEAQATRLLGASVRVNGAIDARLLPTPSLVLRDIKISTTTGALEFEARSLDMEFALGSLIRGEWRAAELRLEKPELRLRLDHSGRFVMPAAGIGFDPEHLGVERLVVEDGRAVLADAASGARFVLEELSFSGEVRSLIGPFKGEGAVVSAGQSYAFRMMGGRRGDDGRTRLRLSVDRTDWPLAVETEGTLWVERERPQFEGSLSVVRPAGLVVATGKKVISEPWRATGHVKMTTTEALFEQIEFVYGPEERAIRLTGTADARFGPQARLQAVLSARQIDLDRIVVAAGTTQRSPLAVLRSLLDGLVEGMSPVPLTVGIGIDSVVLAGVSLTAVRADFESEGPFLRVDTLEFRAPGASQIHVSGRLYLAHPFEFTGAASVVSPDPEAFFAWLEGRPEAAKAPPGPLRMRGDLTLSSERIAIEQFRAEFERKTIEGKVAYRLANGQGPARLDAKLIAEEFDLDWALALASSAAAGSRWDRPSEVALALELGKLTYAGLEAKNVNAAIKFDSSGLDLGNLTIGDLGGMAVSATGRIDNRLSSPHGSLALTLKAHRLDGAVALAAHFLPQLADTLRSLSAPGGPTELEATLALETSSSHSSATKTTARFSADGAVAGIRIHVQAAGIGDPAVPSTANVRVDGRLEADDGAALARLLKLDWLAAVEKEPARFVFTATGPLNGPLAFEGRFAGAGLEASATGSLRSRPEGAAGTVDARLATRAQSPRREVRGGASIETHAQITIAGKRVTLDELETRIFGTTIKGRLSLLLDRPVQVEGRLDVDAVDMTAVAAATVGGAQAEGSPLLAWAAEPFRTPAFADLTGAIEFSVAHAIFAPSVIGHHLRGRLLFDRSVMSFESLQGVIGEGLFSGSAHIRSHGRGLSCEVQVMLANADMASLLPQNARGSVNGRVSLQFTVTGTGLSPAALIGALQGSGVVTLEDLQIAGLDPKAIDAAIRMADRGVAVDTARIESVARTALAAGVLNVPVASGTITIDGGRATFPNLTVPAEGADVAFSGMLDVAEQRIDLRLTLIGPPKPPLPTEQRPQLRLALRGPIAAPQRTIDATSLVNWLTLRAVEQEARRLQAAEEEAKARKAVEAQRAKARQEAQTPEMPQGTMPAVENMPVERAPVLPPPINILPVPDPSQHHGVQGTPRANQDPASAMSPSFQLPSALPR